MGAVLLAAGTAGKRFALPNSRILIHQPWGGAQGQASDIAIQAKEILRIKDRLNQILVRPHEAAARADRGRRRPGLHHGRRAGEGLRRRGPRDLATGAVMSTTKKAGADGEVLRCSFCNKDQNDVRKLIAGPTVFICDECVDVCNDIIADDRRAEGRTTRTGAAHPAGDQEVPRRVRDRPGAGEEEARGRGLQPLQADRDQQAARPQRRRAHQVEHPAHRADRHGQDAPRPDPRPAPLRPLHDRGRHDPHRGRLRRRGRREHHPEAPPGRGRRHREVPGGHHLHRRDRQDLAQGREPLHHPRRLRRGRPAGAPQDPRGHGRQRAAAGRAEAPAPGVLPDRHHEHPVHLRRRLRRPRQGDRAAGGQEDARLQDRREEHGGPRPGQGEPPRPDPAHRPHQVRPHPRVRGPAARGGDARTTSTRPPWSRS